MWVKGEIFRNLEEAAPQARSLDRDTQILFDRFDWIERTWAHCPMGERPLIVRARAEGSDCWLFLSETAPGKAAAIASWYTLSFRPVFTGEPTEAVKRALLTASARRLARHISSVRFAPVPEAETELLIAAFGRAGWTGISTETNVNWTVETAGLSFEEYWAARPGELRSTVKRKRAKVETKIFQQFDADAWESYEQVYADSWKPTEGTPSFLRAMAEDEGQAGALRLGIASIEGQAVAAQLWTVGNGTAIIHKLAHREGAATLSPGSVLSAAMFEHVIDRDHVQLVDFGTGDDEYKADWMDTRRPLFTVELFNTKTVAGVAGAARAYATSLAGRLRGR